MFLNEWYVIHNLSLAHFPNWHHNFLFGTIPSLEILHLLQWEHARFSIRIKRDSDSWTKWKGRYNSFIRFYSASAILVMKSNPGFIVKNRETEISQIVDLCAWVLVNNNVLNEIRAAKIDLPPWGFLYRRFIRSVDVAIYCISRFAAIEEWWIWSWFAKGKVVTVGVWQIIPPDRGNRREIKVWISCKVTSTDFR